MEALYGTSSRSERDACLNLNILLHVSVGYGERRERREGKVLFIIIIIIITAAAAAASGLRASDRFRTFSQNCENVFYLCNY